MTGVDGDIHRRGYYVHFGYRILPKLEVVARYDTFDADIRRNITLLTADEKDYIGGINYYIKDNNFKLQLNYVRKTFSDGLTPTRNLFMAQLQTAW
jgi:phosphate-selective porin